MRQTTHGRRRASALVTAIIALLLLAGCTGGDDSAPSDGDPVVDAAGGVSGLEPPAGDRAQEGSVATESDQSSGLADSPVLTDRSVVYTVDLVVETSDVTAARDEAEAIAARLGGYVQSEGTYGVPGPPLPVEPLPVEPGLRGEDGTLSDGGVASVSPDEQTTLVLRVPAERHEEAVEALEVLGETVSRNRNAQDVTEQVVDVETRIETQQASIDRLQALLGEATQISDILAIETELTSRIAELESLQARQEQLSSATRLATVTVSFVPPQTVVDEGTGFVAGLEAGWRAFVRAIELGLTMLGALLPFGLALAIVAVPLVAWLVWRHRRRAAPAGSSTDRASQGTDDVSTGPEQPEPSAPSVDR